MRCKQPETWFRRSKQGEMQVTMTAWLERAVHRKIQHAFNHVHYPATALNNMADTKQTLRQLTIKTNVVKRSVKR